MGCKLYVGLPTLTQAQANQLSASWIAIHFPDLNEAIKASWRLDHVVPPVNVPWIIECDGGQRLRLLVPPPNVGTFFRETWCRLSDTSARAHRGCDPAVGRQIKEPQLSLRAFAKSSGFLPDAGRPTIDEF